MAPTKDAGLRYMANDPPPPQPIHDALMRLGLKPHKDFHFVRPSDSLMQLNASGIQKLVKMHFRVKPRNLHVSMLPNDDGIVETALVTAADKYKRPGFWYIIIDGSGRPVAEHPLTYTRQILDTHESTSPLDSLHPPSGQKADKPMHWRVESHGDLARALVSWLVGYDRVNDDASTKVLEILSNYLESRREIILELVNKDIAQRLHDEIICYEDDISTNDVTAVQAADLRERIALLFIPGTVEYP